MPKRTLEELILKVEADISGVKTTLNDLPKEIKKASKGIEKEGTKKLSENVKQFAEETKKVGSSVSRIFNTIKSNWLGATAAITSTLFTIKKAFDISKESARFQQSAEAMGKQFGISFDLVLSKLKEASSGTISNTELITAANRTMALNVTQDLDEMAKLLEIARVRGRAMGIDTAQAFDNLTLGIGRGCLSGDTIIQTNTGRKPLYQIKAGEKVLSYNFEKKEIEFQKVKNFFYNGIKETYKVYYGDDSYIIATGIHEFYTDEGWKKTDELTNKNKLYLGKHWTGIIEIEKYKTIKVFDLCIEHNENYFANGILIHNSALILDNLGIITKGWDEQAKAVGRTLDTQFILEKVLEDGKQLDGKSILKKGIEIIRQHKTLVITQMLEIKKKL